ncbi:polysaccharide biosynthesis protein [Cytobacillus spongiae]|uniref:putative polysaccharide biosynthesis protein n=1 Tax=Cytobacillus spongiae TaxID=2901381 RepID=UPI001F360CB8|nr:polysaccharide biosynthesis protein [Cytobacillus spongiae]UII56015.1 polysaccharide biosynthesis protein [Cytobacillus spongiae]
MEPTKQAKDLFKGALILTVAALVMKVLSAIYRVPFQNIVGDVGFYIYQQVYPFYGMALILSTYGFPVVISKLYVETGEQRGREDQRQLIVISSLFLTVLGIGFFSLFYFGAEWLAGIMGDKELAVIMKVLAVIYLFFPAISLLRGVFQATGDMLPTAVSQVSEQTVRVSTILIASTVLIQKGMSLYIVSSGAMFGSITGGLISVLVLLTFLVYRKRGEETNFLNLPSITWRKSLLIIKKLSIEGFAISISSMLLIFLQMADSFNFFSLLLSQGVEGEEAKVLKGVYDRGQPLIQLGTIVATSLSLSLVPLITSAKLKEDVEFLKNKVRLALQVSVFIGVAATAGLFSIIKPTNIMLFENTDGSHVLAVMSLVILLSSLILTITAILQGLGYALFPAFVIFVSFFLKLILNWLLIPNYGALGGAIASNVTLVVILFMLMSKLRMVMKVRFVTVKFIQTILLGALSMIVFLKGYLLITNGLYSTGSQVRFMATFQALSAVILGGFIYIYVVLRGHVFKKEELSLLPFGSKLIALLPKNRR